MRKEIALIALMALAGSLTMYGARKKVVLKGSIPAIVEETVEETVEEPADTLDFRIELPLVADSAFLAVREADEILESIEVLPEFRQRYNPFSMPSIYAGYRPSKRLRYQARQRVGSDKFSLPVLDSSAGEWLRRQQVLHEDALDMIYANMLAYPESMEGVYDLLHKGPPAISPDSTFTIILEGYNDAGFRFKKPVFPVYEQGKTHWLHVVNAGVQLSQAYLSPNWYQGGNNHLSLLVNFLWDVQLNQVYHPNTMLQSVLSYKLGLNSNPKEQYHRYSISQDLFQWNFKAGFRSFKKWFYTFTAQFKTQLLNNYESDSDVRTASFLSSGDLNLGLGMTYTYTSPQKKLKLNASIAPVSYNLKTCIDSRVNPGLFGIPEGKKTVSEIGSNGELTMEWTMTGNISYKTRLFLFTDYSYFMGDWENTINFSINRFLSTQLYLHLRYDSSSPNQSDWHHWMLKEILSFGFSYTFSTK